MRWMRFYPPANEPHLVDTIYNLESLFSWRDSDLCPLC